MQLLAARPILYTAKLDRSTIVILWALELKLDVDLACDGHEYAAFACDPSMQVTANRYETNKLVVTFTRLVSLPWF